MHGPIRLTRRGPGSACWLLQHAHRLADVQHAVRAGHGYAGWQRRLHHLHTAADALSPLRSRGLSCCQATGAAHLFVKSPLLVAVVDVRSSRECASFSE